MGGFHMIGFPREKIEKAIKVFKDTGVEEVHTGHCTGLRAEYLMMEAYQNKFHKIHAGYKAEFKAKT
jgi:7,8-dihydropterin-6-yl-methyl-4-(beta-D-ribofuranosyl)aminobenzene 5'-phosphate synthase